MSGLFYRHPGSRNPNSNEYNSLVDLARSARLTGGSGADTYTDRHGQVTAPPAEAEFHDSSFVQVLNTDSAPPPPLYGIGEIYGYVKGNPGDLPTLQVRQPTTPGGSNLCIFMEDSPPQNYSVWAVHSGVAVVQYVGTISQGIRLCATAGQWYAQPYQLGPMLVVEDYGMIGGANYCSVKLTGERGDTKLLVDANGNLYSAKTIIWLGYNVNWSSPGIPAITKAS